MYTWLDARGCRISILPGFAAAIGAGEQEAGETLGLQQATDELNLDDLLQ